MVIQVNTNTGVKLGETSTTAHRGDRGKIAYDHSQSTHAPTDAEKNVNPDWNSSSGGSQILNKPTLGTAASKNVAASGNASATEVVYGTDTRLSDARTPTSHSHSESDITGLATSLSSKSDTGHNHSGTYEPANANIQSHVTSSHAPTDAEKNSDITKAEIEAKLTGEISSHSHAGGSASGIRNSPNVVVSVSGSTYTAVSASGATISTGDTASTVINAALSSLSTGGECRIASGYYVLTATINIPKDCKLSCDKFVYFDLFSDIDVFTLVNGSELQGGEIYVVNVSGGYTKDCIKINGSNADFGIGSEQVCAVRDVKIMNDTYTGTAIRMTSENATYGCIYGAIIDNIRITGFLTGIYMYRSGARGVNWINGNKISNIYTYMTRRAIYMDSSLTTSEDLYGNVFENISYQVDGDTPTEPAIRIHGSTNVFKNITIYDWDNAWGAAISLTANSYYNFVEVIHWEGAIQVSDLGTTNMVTDQLMSNVKPREQLIRAAQLFSSANALKVIDSYTTPGVDQQASAANGDYFIFNVWSDAATEWTIDVNVAKSNAMGKFDLYLNGVSESTGNDCYNSTAANAMISIGISHAMKVGWNIVKLVLNGKNASSSGYSLATMGIRIR